MENVHEQESDIVENLSPFPVKQERFAAYQLQRIFCLRLTALDRTIFYGLGSQPLSFSCREEESWDNEPALPFSFPSFFIDEDVGSSSPCFPSLLFSV